METIILYIREPTNAGSFYSGFWGNARPFYYLTHNVVHPNNSMYHRSDTVCRGSHYNYTSSDCDYSDISSLYNNRIVHWLAALEMPATLCWMMYALITCWTLKIIYKNL